MDSSHSQTVARVDRFRRFFGVGDDVVGVDVVVDLQVFGVVPHAHVEQECDEDADGGKDGEVDPHLVDVVDEAVGLLAALVAPHGASLVHDGADDERRRQDGQQRQHRERQCEAGSLKSKMRLSFEPQTK